VLEKLKTVSKTIHDTTEQHRLLSSDDFGAVLSDIECELCRADTLVRQFCDAKKKWWANPKGVLGKLTDSQDKLESLYGLLCRALKVGGPV
jgi:hypothetical protein